VINISGKTMHYSSSDLFHLFMRLIPKTSMRFVPLTSMHCWNLPQVTCKLFRFSGI